MDGGWCDEGKVSDAGRVRARKGSWFALFFVISKING